MTASQETSGPELVSEEGLAALDRLIAERRRARDARQEAALAELQGPLEAFRTALASALHEAGLPSNESALKAAFAEAGDGDGSLPGPYRQAALRALAQTELHPRELLAGALAGDGDQPEHAFVLVDVLTVARVHASSAAAQREGS